MRRSDRQFMRNMIILAVTGLSLLMVILFVALSTFLSKPGKGSTYTKEKEEMIEQPVELSETLTVLIENITDTHINGYDIHNKKAFDKLIMDTVKVSDAYGNVLPISQL